MADAVHITPPENLATLVNAELLKAEWQTPFPICNTSCMLFDGCKQRLHMMERLNARTLFAEYTAILSVRYFLFFFTEVVSNMRLLQRLLTCCCNFPA